jgi:hypothetical protein
MEEFTDKEILDFVKKNLRLSRNASGDPQLSRVRCNIVGCVDGNVGNVHGNADSVGGDIGSVGGNAGCVYGNVDNVFGKIGKIKKEESDEVD